MSIKKKLRFFLNNLIAYKKNIDINTFNINVSPKILIKAPKYKYKVMINDAKLSGEISIGEGCNFFNKPSCYGNVELGKFVSINGPGTRISSIDNKIKIGNFSSIGSNTIIQQHYHKYDRISSYSINKNIFNKNMKNDIYSKGNILLEEDVWVGSNSVILSGIKIGRGSIIGAGSVVSKDIPPYSIAVGNPAKVIKKRFKKRTIEILEEIMWWNWEIEKIKRHEHIFNYSEKEILDNKNEILSLKKESIL